MNSLFQIDMIILFFVLGAVAAWLRSDLDFPQPVSKFLAIFLLISLGLKGGHEVSTAESLDGIGAALAIGIAACVVIPFYMFFLFKKRLGEANAAALASCYGSVSAVTFVAAKDFLVSQGVVYSGYFVAITALMEIPAIVIGLRLYSKAAPLTLKADDTERSLPNVFVAKSVVLLFGGFLIGMCLQEHTWNSIKPVVHDSFHGFLAFFLLDLGLQAQRHFRSAWQQKGLALLVATILPLIHGAVAVILGHYFGLQVGDQVLLGALVGSASYIAAPTAIHSSLPQANPSLYVALPLAITFPLNVVVSIPLYFALAKFLAAT
jgi:hypothetical protein